MTLNNNVVRTLVASLILLLTFAAAFSNDAQAREIRIFPTPVAGLAPCAAAATACDLVRAAAGLAPITGPDAGVIPQPGDTLVLAPGTYALVGPSAAPTAAAGTPPNDGTGPVIIPGAAAAAFGFPTAMEDLEIRSRSGAAVTIIQPGAAATAQANIYVLADNVQIGGDDDDTGMTVQNSAQDFPNIDVGGWTFNWIELAGGGLAAYPLALIPGGQADEDFVLKNNFIQNAGTTARIAAPAAGTAPGADVGVYVGYPGPAAAAGACATRSLENFRIQGNEMRNNSQSGMVFGPCVSNMGGTTEDEEIHVIENTFDGNGARGITGAAGCAAAPPCVYYQDGLTIDNTGQVQRLRVSKNLFVRNIDNGFNIGASGVNAFCQGLPAIQPAPAAGGAAFALNAACGGAAQNSNGAAAGAPGQIEDSIIDGNVSWQNGVVPAVVGNTVGAGIVIANNGQVENLEIVSNRDETDPENLGLTGNGGPGLVFLGHNLAIVAGNGGAAFTTGNVPTNPRHPLTLYNTGSDAATAGKAVLTGAGGLISDLDEVRIYDNAVTENGQGDPDADGFFGVVEGLIDGIAILINGDIDPVYLANNDVRLNYGDGVLYAPVGRIRESMVNDNLLRNNGAHPACPAVPANPTNALGPIVPLCDIDNNADVAVNPNIPDFVGNGFSAVLPNDVDGLHFANNVVRENLFHGIFLGSLTSDIDDVDFNGDLVEKNGLGLLSALGLATPAQSGDGVEMAAFGDITTVDVVDSSFLQNGGSGFAIDATSGSTLPTYFPASAGGAAPPAQATGGFGVGAYGAPGQLAPPVSLGDLDQVNVSGSMFNLNGASSPIGAGNGFFTLSDKTSDVNVDGSEAHNNDDHGFFNNTVDDLNNVLFTNVEANGNDRNNDTVGAGVFNDSTEDMDDVVVDGVTANDNYHGVHFDIRGENGRNVSALNSSFENNRETGILITAADDLANVSVNGNLSQCNSEQFRIAAVDRGDDIIVENNRFIGCSGVGIVLDASGVTITNNDIRDNDVGVDVDRAEENAINQNNIARNKLYGVDATGLGPNEEIDATENWWGEPSGPEHDTNPGGFGDEVTDKVLFDPWLGEPVGDTLSAFEITNFEIPDTGNVGEEVIFTARVENTGSEEGVGVVGFKVFNSDGDLVNSSSRTITLDPQGSTNIDFGFTFLRGGTYTIEVTTGDDSNSATIEVLGATGVTIESVCDANNNDRIDDDEILTCIGFWVTGEEVPGTGESISDAKILFLVELWVTNGDISTLPASARSASWVESVVNFFVPAATVNQQAVNEVAAGDSFTVTTTVNANDSIQGVILSEQLPEGWTISEVTTAGGFFKPSESKWLWLNTGTKTVTFTVNVPADAAEGTYSIAANLNSANGFSTSSALNVRVSNPEILSVNSVAFNGSSFVAYGSGVTSVDVQVYNLSGSLVFDAQSVGNTLAFNGLSNDGQVLANGVYLYVMTVNGSDNQMVRTNVSKFVVLR